MKERAILFCLVVFLLSACAPVGTLVQPTPTPTKTPRPMVTPIQGATVWIEYLESTKSTKTAVVKISIVDPEGNPATSRIVVLERGQVGIIQALYADLYLKIYLWLDEQGKLRYKEEGEPEWRVPVKHEPLQL